VKNEDREKDNGPTVNVVGLKKRPFILRAPEVRGHLGFEHLLEHGGHEVLHERGHIARPFFVQ